MNFDIPRNADVLPRTVRKRRSRRQSWSVVHPKRMLLWVCIWYFFSATSTFINKILIKQYSFPAELLTIFHLAVGTCCDAVLLSVPKSSKMKEFQFHPIRTKNLLQVLPISLMAVGGKLLTYWSYAVVPVSITHTAKASTPIFNVALAYILYSRKQSLLVYLSLLPIVCGVAMASISELRINDFALNGVIYSVMAAMLSVVQNMYSKHVLNHNIVHDMINLHFYNGLLSVVINIPTLVYTYTMNNHFKLTISWSTLVLSSIVQFVGSLASYYILSKSSDLTYSIFGALKRVVIIFGAILYFGNPVTVQSLFGMLFAVFGICCYQVAKSKS